MILFEAVLLILCHLCHVDRFFCQCNKVIITCVIRSWETNAQAKLKATALSASRIRMIMSEPWERWTVSQNEIMLLSIFIIDVAFFLFLTSCVLHFIHILSRDISFWWKQLHLSWFLISFQFFCPEILQIFQKIVKAYVMQCSDVHFSLLSLVFSYPILLLFTEGCWLACLLMEPLTNTTCCFPSLGLLEKQIYVCKIYCRTISACK